MTKASKEEFKEAMRMAKIEEEVEREMNESITGDSSAAYFAQDSEADIEAHKRKPGRSKKETPKETHVVAAPKKGGRKPKTEAQRVKEIKKAACRVNKKATNEAIEKAGREEAIRFLIDITKGRMSEIIIKAEHHLRTADKLTNLADYFGRQIETVEEMLK